MKGEWIREEALDDETRALCREHLTPRNDGAGHTLWPLDELNPWLTPDLPPAPVAEDAMLERAIQREAQRRQAARRQKRNGSTPKKSSHPSPWVHVPLAELFEAAGNSLYPTRKGEIETGHEPLHTSKSGKCVQVNPTLGVWWCRGCRQGGDAVGLVQALHGWDYATATAWLTAQYGPPARPTLRPVTLHRGKRRFVVELS